MTLSSSSSSSSSNSSAWSYQLQQQQQYPNNTISNNNNNPNQHFPTSSPNATTTKIPSTSTPTPTTTTSHHIRNLLAFFLNGILNNYPYVVMISAAQFIIEDYVGLTLLANILPTLIIKLTAPFFMHYVPYNIRILIVTLVSFLSFFFVAWSPVAPLKLFGVVLASIGAGLGEITFLAMISFYHENCVSAWSAGTGMAGIAGSASYLLLVPVAKMDPRWALMIIASLPLWMLFSAFVLLTGNHNAGRKWFGFGPLKRVQDKNGVDVSSANGGRFSHFVEETPVSPDTGEDMNGNNMDFKGNIASFTDHSSKKDQQHATQQKLQTEGYSTLPSSPSQVPPIDEQHHEHMPKSTPLEGSVVSQSGHHHEEEMATTTTTPSGSPLPNTTPTKPRLQQISSYQSSASKTSTPRGTPNSLTESSEQDSLLQKSDMAPPYSEMDEEAFQLHDHMFSGETKSSQRGAPLKPDEQELLTVKERIAHLLPLFWYMFPLFLVYYSEYVINTGIAPNLTYARGWIAADSDYIFYVFCYSLGVLISRSSVNVVPIRSIWGLWLISFLQFGNMVFMFCDAYFRIVPWVYITFVLIFWEGLLGGACYVNAFYQIQTQVKPKYREFSMGVVSVADSFGICLSALTSLYLQSWLKNHQYHKDI